MSKTIEVVVSPTGETSVTTKGFAGAECQAASKTLEQALGAASSEQLTAEYYHSAEQRSTSQERA